MFFVYRSFFVAIFDSLEHRRNIGCLTLFYRYNNGKSPSEIHDLVPNLAGPAYNTRASQNVKPPILAVDSEI